MAITFIQPKDFNTDHFEIKKGKVCAKRTASKYTLNWMSPQTDITTNNPADYGNGNRRYLQILNGIGKIHLDFKPLKDVSYRVNVASLPAGCPRPSELIETQTHDGGSLWIDAGNSVIIGSGLKANTRYIVDIIGFFPDA